MILPGRTVEKYEETDYRGRRGLFTRIADVWRAVKAADSLYAEQRLALGALAERGTVINIHNGAPSPQQETHVKNQVQVIPTSNGFIVTIPNQSTDNATVVESVGRDPNAVMTTLGKAVMDLCNKELPKAPAAQPAAPAPAVQQ